MEVTHVLDKYNVCRILEDIYNTAKMYNGSRIILLNTYNRQSTSLNPNRYSINVLKETNNGNEEVVYSSHKLLDTYDQKIICEGIDLFKQNKNHDINVEVWTDTSSPVTYW